MENMGEAMWLRLERVRHVLLDEGVPHDVLRLETEGVPEVREGGERPGVAGADAHAVVAEGLHAAVAQRHLEDGAQVDPDASGGDRRPG